MGCARACRDLKPDNILMDERGKTRISDLGLACKVTPDLVGTYGTRGCKAAPCPRTAHLIHPCTRELTVRLLLVCSIATDWAPEMIMKDSKGHRIRYNQCVDWFSFGRFVSWCPCRSECGRDVGGLPLLGVLAVLQGVWFTR